MADGLVFLARGLTKVYDMGEVQVHALRGVDLELRASEFTVLLGPSGSGKSTLLNILGGLDLPTTGEVFYRGGELTRASDDELTQYRRHHVGFVFQFYNLIPSLTARENVALVTEIVPSPMQPGGGARAGRPGRPHGPLSLPAFRRPAAAVAIARAIAKKPDVLLCDEPTGALDIETGILVLEAIATVEPRAGHHHRGDHPQRRHRRHGRPGDLAGRRADRRHPHQPAQGAAARPLLVKRCGRSTRSCCAICGPPAARCWRSAW